MFPAALSAQAVNSTLEQVEKLSISAGSSFDLTSVRVDSGKPFNTNIHPGGPGGGHTNPPPHTNPPGPVGGGHNNGGHNGGNNGNHNGNHNPPPPHNGGGHNPPPPHNGGGHNGGVIIVNPPPPYHPGYNNPSHPGYHNPHYPSYPPGYYGPGHHDTTPVYSGPVDAKVVWITVGVILAIVLLAILV